MPTACSCASHTFVARKEAPSGGAAAFEHRDRQPLGRVAATPSMLQIA